MLRRFDGRRRKIAFIGASYKFVHQAIRDFLLCGRLENTDVVLYDIDRPALQLEHDVIGRMIRQKSSRITVSMARSRREALDGADYAIVSVLVGGLDVAEAEDNICQEYGIRHTVGDTVGPMCTSRCLRMAPLLLDIAADMEKYCPGAPMISVTNPMAVLTHAVNTHTKVQCLGVCHGTGFQIGQIARAFHVDENAVCVDVVGVNHLGFIQRVEIEGQDIPAAVLKRKLEAVAKAGYLDTATRTVDASEWSFEFFKLTGLLPNNGDHHFVEFFPWFLARHAFVRGRNVYGLDRKLHSAAARRKNKAWFRETVSRWAYGADPIPDMDRYGGENLMDIILGLENQGYAKTSELHLNVTNGGAVPNLPADCNLELTCHITPRGAQPVQVAPLAPYPLGVLMPLVSLNALSMKAAVEKDRQAFLEALLLDPLLQDFRSVRALADRLWKINAKWWKPVK